MQNHDYDVLICPNCGRERTQLEREVERDLERESGYCLNCAPLTKEEAIVLVGGIGDMFREAAKPQNNCDIPEEIEEV